MAQIKKINIKGVEYDITGDTSYVENETLVISKGTSESSGTGGGETIFEVALTGVTISGSTITIPTQSVAITEEQYETLTTNRNAVIRATLIENVLIMELKPFISEVEGLNLRTWYGFFQYDTISIGLKCVMDFYAGALVFENIGAINEGAGASNNIIIDLGEIDYSENKFSIDVVVGTHISQEDYYKAYVNGLHTFIILNDIFGAKMTLCVIQGMTTTNEVAAGTIITCPLSTIISGWGIVSGYENDVYFTRIDSSINKTPDGRTMKLTFTKITISNGITTTTTTTTE